jgi:hypothetical protein
MLPMRNSMLLRIEAKVLVQDLHIERAWAQTYSSEIFDFGCLSGGEEHGLSIFVGQDLDHLFNFVFEPNVKDPISFVNNERLSARQ